MWNLPAPPGFQGLRDDVPLRIYERYLPHWRQDGATYFVTFRLADSLPASRLRELTQLKAAWARRYPPPRPKRVLERLARMIFSRIEHWLDQGYGDCVLADPRAGVLVHESLQYFHGERYELGASVVMPNHVHCIIRPLVPDDQELENILRSIKTYCSGRINALLHRPPPLWLPESYDRIIRDEPHLWHAIQYIGRNPRKARRSNEACYLWLNPEWQKLGWRFVV